MLLEFCTIFVFLYVGNFISSCLPVPIPGTVIGMLLLFFSLHLKLLKLESIEKAASILLMNMAILFIPPGVSLVKSLRLLEGSWMKIILVMIVTTIITIAVTGIFIQWFIGRCENGKSIK
ncbi:CidA/LrgA family protein [Ilyobacter polytropus]|uniref:LrgA family protein n=1 Tax=Ilyobacter polytropus (strain ATCC 51220 / DSM 2926 / LMG 16218 / CuHBu1) TaxID=572544 RepID=E3HBV8_ILYPC|nr:CidA/LrgA family protein [Ilyobacter polytropus]ADO83870.1 LrgA family protein [Ilyobacter polytropus DSM 2926]